MTYYVSCSKCELERQIEEFETIIALEEQHNEQYDDYHVLEFESNLY